MPRISFSTRELSMSEQYRRLTVFVDHPSEDSFLWVILESTDDPAIWLDLETGNETYASWTDAYEAGNTALLAYVDDENLGPTRHVELHDEEESEDE
jgi:hypothetical protein